MAKLKLIQAEYGDCMILQYENNGSPRNMLIDGGPGGTYKNHLSPILKYLNEQGEQLDYMVLSHVDTDHISGLLDCLYEIEEQRVNNNNETVSIGNIWANTFQNTIGKDNDIVERFQSVMTMNMSAMAAMPMSSIEIQGINQGNKLRLQALKLNIPLNANFTDSIVMEETATEAILDGEMKIKIIGPNNSNLEALRIDWLKWLEKNEESIASGDPNTLSNSDRSKPNLSSIMFLAEVAGTSILLTGDGRSDHIYESLSNQGFLNNGKMHVDILKMPHHGSDRNMTRWFLKKITADTYVFSANGKHGNPDLPTLIWVVESAKERNETVKLVFTNHSYSVGKLLEEYPQDDYGYSAEVMPDNYHYIDINL